MIPRGGSMEALQASSQLVLLKMSTPGAMAGLHDSDPAPWLTCWSPCKPKPKPKPKDWPPVDEGVVSSTNDMHRRSSPDLLIAPPPNPMPSPEDTVAAIVAAATAASSEPDRTRPPPWLPLLLLSEASGASSSRRLSLCENPDDGLTDNRAAAAAAVVVVDGVVAVAWIGFNGWRAGVLFGEEDQGAGISLPAGATAAGGLLARVAIFAVERALLSITREDAVTAPHGNTRDDDDDVDLASVLTTTVQG